MRTRIILPLLLIIGIAGCKSYQKNTKSDPTGRSATFHNSKISLDWAGVYRGTLPCADCEGIQSEIRLKKGRTYEIALKYLGKSEVVIRNSGPFKWDEAGNKITLVNINSKLEPNQYFVGENSLTKTDMKGNRIQGSLSDRYDLQKDKNSITERYWKLIELNGQKVPESENPKKEAHIILKIKDNQVIGNGGCNSLNGTYSLSEGSHIKFSRMVSTRMACPGMETEQQLLNALESAENYFINSDTLLLHKAKMSTMAKFASVYFK